MEAEVIATEIKHGKDKYRIDAFGHWKKLFFGSYKDTPKKGNYWRWIDVHEDNVPEQVKQKAN